jgi:FkbM family methyltransferase
MSFSSYRREIAAFEEVSTVRAFLMYSKKNIVRLTIRPLKNVAPLWFTRLTRWNLGYERQLAFLVGKNAELLEQQSAQAIRPLFIDCGVNEGFVLNRYAEALPRFSFIGFEIQEELIGKAARANPDAEIRHQAVTTHDGPVNIYLPRAMGTNFRGGSTTEKGKVTGKNLFEQRSVDGIDLWRFVSEKRRSGCDFIAIKLDVEGTEYRLIDSLYTRWRDSGEQLVDYLMVEFHEDLLPEGRDVHYYAGVLKKMKVHVSRWL